jgi:hypothetical protein
MLAYRCSAGKGLIAVLAYKALRISWMAFAEVFIITV